jgi:hypothetical protein
MTAAGSETYFGTNGEQTQALTDDILADTGYGETISITGFNDLGEPCTNTLSQSWMTG